MAGETGLYRKPSLQTLGWWWKVPFMWRPVCLARAGEPLKGTTPAQTPGFGGFPKTTLQ